MKSDPESERLRSAREPNTPWQKWGPYLTERQWGTVREDYSENGDAWNHFTHDQARSRAYHWGEDGLAGISDDRQFLCFALVLWNGKDPILKERLFGLTNSEGNHGEDVKEYYFYLDSTPTHSYMKYLYKYPQRAYPYCDLVNVNRRRSRTEYEYELLDTGVFDDNRYFDVFVEYAKNTPEDILIQITVCNRGPERAVLHVLPTLWFRNTWTWWPGTPKPILRHVAGFSGVSVIEAQHDRLGERFLYCEGSIPLLFTDNETNTGRLGGTRSDSHYFKDGINDFVVSDKASGINPENFGTKASAYYQLPIDAGHFSTIWLRLCDQPAMSQPFTGFGEIVQIRRREADEFYRGVTPPGLGDEKAAVMRQALAGMLWSKQYFNFDVTKWLEDHGADPMHQDGRPLRNREWFHMILSSTLGS